MKKPTLKQIIYGSIGGVLALITIYFNELYGWF